MTEAEMLSDEQLKEIEALSAKVPDGPWFTATDDADDVPEHRRSGLALVETGRSADWWIARLCECHTANFIAASKTNVDALCQTVRALREQLAESDRIIKSYNDQEWKSNTALREQLAQVEKERNNLQVHVEERDFLLNSQTTGKHPLPENFVCIAPAEAPLVIDLLCGQPTETARVHLELCARCKEFASLADTVATAMRSRCVEKVREMQKDWRLEADVRRDPDAPHDYKGSYGLATGAVDACDNIIETLESLPLGQGEREKR